MSDTNDHLVLISGPSSTGKSASLININDQPGVMYLNTESNKKLPFANKFDKYTITDPMQVYEAFEAAETTEFEHIHTIVVDSLTFLMDQYESIYVLPSANTMKAWSDFQQYFKKLMQQYVAKSSKNVIFIAHTDTVLTDDHILETKVPVKGALQKNGIESYFSTVVSTKRVPLTKLKDYESDLLDITPDNEIDQFKYVFQTRITKDTINERMRAPMGMFSHKETYMDNDVQLLIDRLHNYYEE